MNKIIEYIETVRKLNELLPDEGFDDIQYQRFFLSTDGYSNLIGYGDLNLWCDEDDDRDYIEESGEKVNLENHIVLKMRKYNTYLPNYLK